MKEELAMSAKIEFGTFEESEKANPYDDTIVAMIEQGEKNPNVSVTLTLPNSDVQKECLKFQKSANAHGKTARRRAIEQGEKETRVTYTLKPREAQRRGKKNGKDAE